MVQHVWLVCKGIWHFFWPRWLTQFLQNLLLQSTCRIFDCRNLRDPAASQDGRCWQHDLHMKLAAIKVFVAWIQLGLWGRSPIINGICLQNLMILEETASVTFDYTMPKTSPSAWHQNLKPVKLSLSRICDYKQALKNRFLKNFISI